MKEPTGQESLAAGVDLVTFSGDKLLGGPQAGIILGRKQYIDCIKSNPLTRALRLDKMTLAALEATLHIYHDERQAIKQIPTLAMLTAPLPLIEGRAVELKNRLNAVPGNAINVELLTCTSKAGGGSLPLLNLPSHCVGVRIDGLSVNSVEQWLRQHSPAIIGRIEDDRFIMDARTLQPDELETIQQAFTNMLSTIDQES